MSLCNWRRGEEAATDRLLFAQPKAMEFVKRAPLLGLGATAALKSHKEKRIHRPGERRGPKKDLVVYDSKGELPPMSIPPPPLTPTYRYPDLEIPSYPVW
jgi:hypothetical protein